MAEGFRKKSVYALAFVRRRFRQIQTVFADDVRLAARNQFVFVALFAMRSFNNNRCLSRASSLTFSSLLAIVPLFAVFVSISTGILQNQGREKTEELAKHVIEYVAPQLRGSFAFTSSELVELPAFVHELTRPTNAISRYVNAGMDEATLQQLAEPDELNSEPVKEALLKHLNSLIRDDQLYEEQRFHGVSLRDETRLFLEGNPQGKDINRRNRMLMEDAYPQFLEKYKESDLDRLVDQMVTFVYNARAAKLGGWGVLALLVVVISMMITIESTFNDVWGVERGRSWFTRLVQYWTTLSIGSVMVFLAMGLDVTTQSKTVKGWVSLLPGNFIWEFLVALVPLFFVFIAFSVIYRTMPNTQVHWSSACVGGAVGAVFWMGNNFSSVFYSSRIERDREIYESFSIVPVLMLGLYLFWLILLFGAQVAYAFQFRNTHLLQRRAATYGTSDRETAGLAIMGEIANRFHQGRGYPTLEELSVRLELPGQLVNELLAKFRDARLVDTVGEAGDRIALHKPAETCAVVEILKAIRNGSSGMEGEDMPGGIVQAESVLSKLRSAEEAGAAGATLRDLVKT